MTAPDCSILDDIVQTFCNYIAIIIIKLLIWQDAYCYVFSWSKHNFFNIVTCRAVNVQLENCISHEQTNDEAEDYSVKSATDLCADGKVIF